MKRREFLRGSVFAATAGLALDACAPESDRLIPILIPEEDFIPGRETWHPTSCRGCSAGCGIEVRKIDGRLVKVEGNPNHPVSRGGVCARGQAQPQAMYHPDRLRSPLVREGERGGGSWTPLSWEEALSRVAEELARVREDDFPLAFLTGELTGHRLQMVRRFSSSFGATRHWTHEPFSDRPTARAHRIATGHEALFGYDLDRAGYIVSFGAEVLEAGPSPVGFARGLAELRRGRPGRRGKLVMAGPRLSLSAANADEWIPLEPGQELELALAVAFVLLDEDRHDSAFVEDHGSGFDAFAALARERGNPAVVSEHIGVSVDRIRRLAREMSEHGPSVAIAHGTAPVALAVSHLNALVGGYGENGLVRFGVPEVPFAPWPAIEGSEPAEQSLASAMSEGAATLPRALFVTDTNPLYSLPSAYGLEERMGSIPFIVSFASFPDETTQIADVVLPESMSFEQFDDAVPAGAGVPLAALTSPLLARTLHDTRSMPDVLIELAGRLELEGFPWSSYEEALREAWAPLGSWSDAVERGGYWDEEARPNRQFATSDGRYRFETAPLTEDPIRNDGGPTLHVYASTAFGDGRTAHLPFLQELADPVTGVRWGSVVEVPSPLARLLGVEDGDEVELTTEHGNVRARAHVSDALHPNVLALAAGQGHTAYGRYAEGRGVNAFALLDARVGLDGTAVSIRKVGT